MKNWYIGQRIVAIRDHGKGLFKRGDEFTIHGLRGSSCRCHHVEIDIGHRDTPHYTRCVNCENLTYSSGTLWFDEVSFAPLDELEQAIEELLEEVNVAVK